MSAPSLSVVILAYDEEENVGPVLGELCAWLDLHEPDSEIVFVDDGSTDGTLSAAREVLAGRRAVFVRHEQNRGMGAGLKSAVTAASGAWLTFLPADGQIPPEAIGTLRAAAAAGDVDLVLSVYDHRDDGAVRKVLSWGVRALILAVHGVRVRSDGPYLLRRTLLDPAQLAPDSFFLNFELPIRAIGAGLPHRRVTVPCRPRLAGVSKSASARRALGVAKDLVDLRRRRLRALADAALGRPPTGT